MEYREYCSSELSVFLSSDERIALPVADHPLVSIIIILFNQAELTFQCLRTLKDAIDVAAEVIIIDNASSDLTEELCRRITGVRIIRNDENIHFIRAVNQAAPLATGEAILLLNNDTSLKRGSISAAYRLIREEQDVGAVGGKIVLLDGVLQEAGSIVWNDGSCLGYGRGRQPSDPEFQFRRDVDYCSGAFLLIRRSLFEQLKWFDTAFAPAYYEETDLCMRIRKAGFRVVYEPTIEVVHFEFGSSSSSKSAIALQQRNRSIFVQRHQDVLRRFHLQPEALPLYARMSRHRSSRILIVDDQIPDPAQGAGFPRARSMLLAIHQAGWFITFYPLNFPKVVWDDAYKYLPRDVEIMSDCGIRNLKQFMSDRAGYYDAVLVSRPHNMKIFKEEVSKTFLNSTTLIYDAEAIFQHAK
jgi:GT2 family glycosyltransferase